jgi:hypothetical protein
MKLKKINEKLREGLVENRITRPIHRKKLFCFKKVRIVDYLKRKWKSTTIVINVIQQLVCEENNRLRFDYCRR